MGQDNTVPRRINKAEGAAGQVMVSGGPGVNESWADPTKEFFVPVTWEDNGAWSGANDPLPLRQRLTGICSHNMEQLARLILCIQKRMLHLPTMLH